MFSFLWPKDGPVVPGHEEREKVFAKHQPEYIPLRTLAVPGPEGQVTSRWTLTLKQREDIRNGADIFLIIATYNQPLQPVNLAIGDDRGAENKFVVFGNRDADVET